MVYEAFTAAALAAVGGANYIVQSLVAAAFLSFRFFAHVLPSQSSIGLQVHVE
jgi:hypothetical protein